VSAPSGRNVLYITMEMAEERIAERIDANLVRYVNIQEIEQNFLTNLFETKVHGLIAIEKRQGTLDY
jgi:hypothetical protein